MRRRRILHQFPISHYCEKTRWHLDLKKLSYSVRNLFPGAHVAINRRLVGHSPVPVLVDGEQVIGDSTNIALYLENTYSGAALLPAERSARARVLELEQYYDEGLGPAVRRYLYGELLREPGAVPRIFFSSYGKAARAVGKVLGGVLEYRLRTMYGIDDAGIDESEQTIREAAERLLRDTSGDADRYLVGQSLTLADVTAASLFAPLFAPPGCPWIGIQLTERARSLRDELTDRGAGRWVAERYRLDRLRAGSGREGSFDGREYLTGSR